MRRLIVAVLTAAAICVPSANAHPLAKNGWTLYERCWKALGAQCGRDIHGDGYRHADGTVTDPTKPQLHEWRDHIRYAMNPPEPVISTVSAPTPAPVATTVAPVTASGSCGGITPYEGGGQCWAIPYYIVQCESGGSYTAYNPSSAGGAYQILGMDPNAPPSEQDAAAAEMWNGGAGASNWVCAG